MLSCKFSADSRCSESGSQWRVLRLQDLTELLDQDNDKEISKSECVDVLWEVAAAVVEFQESLNGIRRAAGDVNVALSAVLLCAAALIYGKYIGLTF